LQSLLPAGLSLAANNGPSLSVVAGSTADIEQFEDQLKQKGINYRRLHTSHAFHSQMMDDVLASFEEEINKISLSAPKIPYLSNLTGNWIKDEEATDAGYWVKHLRHTVRFSEGVEELLKEPERILLEIGPGHTLSMLARQHMNRDGAQIVI